MIAVAAFSTSSANTRAVGKLSWASAARSDSNSHMERKSNPAARNPRSPIPAPLKREIAAVRVRLTSAPSQKLDMRPLYDTQRICVAPLAALSASARSPLVYRQASGEEVSESPNRPNPSTSLVFGPGDERRFADL